MPARSPNPAAEKEKLQAYFARLAPRPRRILKQLRQAARAAAPRARDAWSYSIPALRLDGRVILWYAAWKQHVSLYPMRAGIVRRYARELAGYETAKGTIRFPLDRPLPVPLIKRLVKARVAELSRS